MLCIASILLHSSVQAQCSCFSAEQRAKTAQDGLVAARVAALARVLSVDADGTVRLEVMESFKGAPVNALLTASRGSQACPDRLAKPNESLLVLSFEVNVSVCDLYGSEHYLLPEFRLLTVK